MSLSQEILKGTYEGVERLLQLGAEPNVSDEYGYTPLIHAVATNRQELVELLLKSHADPNLVDITGSTALHWAVDNNHLEITQLLLKFGANPNAYTSNGQPVLFYPLLRKNKTLTQILINKGASVDFAKDFINAKLVGHRFELQGNTDIINAGGFFLAIDLEGFYLEFTLNTICESLARFMNSYVAHRMDIHAPELKEIIATLENAYQLRSFKHFSVDIQANKQQIYPLMDRDLLLLPVSYKGHAITFIRHGDFFAKCDRGVQKMTDPIVIHHIGNTRPLGHHFFTNLLYQRQTEKSMKQDIYQILDLQPYAKLPIKHQITGNCSWANVEASVPTMLYMLLHDHLQDPAKTESLVKEIMTFYRAWLEWDRDRAIEDWLQDFEKMALPRQKTKAALLGAVLFQACNPNRALDVARAKKILTILARKEFHYIVRTYANIFVHKKSSKGKAYQQLIELCGYKITDFSQ